MFLVPQYASRRQRKDDNDLSKASSCETEWRPDAFIPGVHSLDCSPSITSQTPDALAWVKEYEEKRLRSELRFKSRAKRSTGAQVGRRTEGEAAPLVSNSKSHPSTHLPPWCYYPQSPAWSYQVFRNDVYVCRNFPAIPPAENAPSPRAAIYEFSDKSRAHLDHICCNSGHLVQSQFCLTYHEQIPDDGEECKRHLDKWLKAYRRRFPAGLYLWVLEFQKRGAPHFHVFLSAPVDRQMQKKLAMSWARITKGSFEKYDKVQYWWHCRPDNLKEWKMDNGKYVLKEYVVKHAQKDVPKEFVNVGRFWGCSRGMQPIPTIIEPKSIANLTRTAAVPWEPAAVRHYFDKILRRWQERQMNYDRQGNRRLDPQTNKVKKWRNASLIRHESELSGAFKIKNGARVVERLLNYVVTNPPDWFSYCAGLKDKVLFDMDQREQSIMQDMIHRAAMKLKRNPGGLGSGEAEQGASHATPDRACRPVDTGRFQAGQESTLDNDLCRVIGFISLSRRSYSKGAARKRQVKR